jgi:phosphohistidine phosphatase
MELLVIRHDVAEPRDPTGNAHADAQRALSDAGRKRSRRAARALARLVGKLDVLASSGLRRADETALAIAAEFAGVAVERVAALAPGAKPEDLADWLRGLERAETVAIVGHEPGLSLLVTWLVSGLSSAFLELGKGGACLVEIPGRIAPGEARLAWLLRPGQLRRLR